MMRAGIACAVLMVLVSTLSAAMGQPEDVGARARRAQRVVVGTVVDVTSSFAVNRHGDQLIVSELTLNVEETLKGQHASVVSMTIEGGTIGDLTLRVSDMPALRRGERAVMFLDGPADAHLPTDRGRGILKLDRAGSVQGTDLTLDSVRHIVRAARR